MKMPPRLVVITVALVCLVVGQTLVTGGGAAQILFNLGRWVFLPFACGKASASLFIFLTRAGYVPRTNAALFAAIVAAGTVAMILDLWITR